MTDEEVSKLEALLPLHMRLGTDINGNKIHNIRKGGSNSKGEPIDVQCLVILAKKNDKWYDAILHFQETVDEEQFRFVIEKFQQALDRNTAHEVDMDGGEFKMKPNLPVDVE